MVRQGVEQSGSFGPATLVQQGVERSGFGPARHGPAALVRQGIWQASSFGPARHGATALVRQGFGPAGRSASRIALEDPCWHPASRVLSWCGCPAAHRRMPRKRPPAPAAPPMPLRIGISYPAFEPLRRPSARACRPLRTECCVLLRHACKATCMHALHAAAAGGGARSDRACMARSQAPPRLTGAKRLRGARKADTQVCHAPNKLVQRTQSMRGAHKKHL